MKVRFFLCFFNLILIFSCLTIQNIFSQSKFNQAVAVLSYSLRSDDGKINAPSRPRVVRVEKENRESKAVVATGSLEQRVFDLVNEKRIEAGLTPLVWNDRVAVVARVHSENMANLDFFSHAGQDGKRVNDRADAAGLRKWHAIGENIAFNRGFKSPLESAVQSWMNSPGHRDNILKNDWQESGIGVAVKPDGTYYFTQVFLKN